MIRGTKQAIAIHTFLSGANIQFSNRQSCTRPCTINIKRDKNLQMIITKNGCTLDTVMIVLGQFGAETVMGDLIDDGTSAVYDYQINPLTINLVCIK